MSARQARRWHCLDFLPLPPSFFLILFLQVYLHTPFGHFAAVPIMTDDVQAPEAVNSSRPQQSCDSDNLRRQGYTWNSSSLSPSFDNPGSSESIYNAIRVATPNLSARCSGTAYDKGPALEAANIAMFIPTDSSHEDQSLTDHQASQREGKNTNAVWWRNHMPSDQVSHRPPDPSSPLADAQNEHRRAVSLDATHTKHHKWPGKLTPAVTTVQPSHPPPTRQPTPPGLPSFNTPEAVLCSAQFLVGQNGRHHRRGQPGETQRAVSYGDTLRRFFGLSPPTEPGANTFPAVGIGRAEDGTIVQGRFPYRQSGHGTSPARQLQDHPFHLTGLPIAEPERGRTANRSETDVEAGKDTPKPPRPRRRVRILTPPSLRRASTTLDGTQETAVSPRSRKSARGTLLGLMQTSAQSETPSMAAPSTVAIESSVQAMGVIGEHDLPQAQVQSVLSRSISGERTAEETTTEETTAPHPVADILFWLPFQIHGHCCLGSSSVRSSREDLDSLDVIASRDTYATAREYQSESGYWSWFSSVYHFIWPRSLSDEQSRV